MRREGYEMSISKPRVVMKEIDGVKQEPYETLNVEVPTEKMGPVMEMVGNRRGLLEEMTSRGEYTQLRFAIPARGLIGLRTRMLNATQGTAIIHHRFFRIPSCRSGSTETTKRRFGFPWSQVGLSLTHCSHFKSEPNYSLHLG